VAGVLPQRRQQPFREREDVFRSDERRFDVDLGEFGLPIGAQIFVAETAGDLEVPVIPGDHQELLIDLRRLRQRIELPRMQSARNDVIARSGRRRLRKNWRLYLEVPSIVEKSARRLLKLVSEYQVFLQLGPTQIQIAVFEPELFGGQLFAFAAGDWNRRRFGWPNYLEIARSYLDVASLHLGVAHLGWTRGNVTFDHYHRLEAEPARPLDDIRRSPFRIEGHLQQTRSIAEIEEDYAAQISGSMYPTAESDFGADVRRSELTAQMGALCRGEAGCGCRGGQRRIVWVD